MHASHAVATGRVWLSLLKLTCRHASIYTCAHVHMAVSVCVSVSDVCVSSGMCVSFRYVCQFPVSVSGERDK